jgi:two-component system LytT family sensor kinase
MQAIRIVQPYCTVELIGFTAGLVIAIMLLALMVHARKLPSSCRSIYLLGACAVLWNLGGLVDAAMVALGIDGHNPADLAALRLQFTGAALWPIPILSIWRDAIELPVARKGLAAFQIAATFTGSVLTVLLWLSTPSSVGLLGFTSLKVLTGYSAVFFAASGVLILLAEPNPPRFLRLSSWGSLGALIVIAALMAIHQRGLLSGHAAALVDVICKQLVLAIVIAVFSLFGRFRFADVFLRNSFRILLAHAFGLAIALTLEALYRAHMTNAAALPAAVRLFGATTLAAGLVFLFAIADRALSAAVNRRLFGTFDYSAAGRELDRRLRQLHEENEVRHTVEDFARHTMELEDVRVLGANRLPAAVWPAELEAGVVAELDPCHPLRDMLSSPELQFLIPVRIEDSVNSYLAISPGAGRRSLVSQEVNFLSNVAAQYGSRLNWLRHQLENSEQRNRESLLHQLVAEAELRALRAQVNPHFLFNSLTAIADLITVDPVRAEATTLQLATVFRYVLANSSRPIVSVREEMDFLRSYLQIEETRFGDRLRVEIEVAQEVAHEPIPSLILQPVVENALKHGLGPKTGPGHLRISAHAQEAQLCLKVEDDGAGPLRTNPQGVGLANIMSRLATLYKGAASLRLEARESGGTCVTLLVPRGPAPIPA